MAKDFATIAFSDPVNALQEKQGSRASYARMERDVYQDGLTENEMDFISQRDSFYMATVGESGFPYIQHRGGPKGFVKVLDARRIGFIDFNGNMQYISAGNLAADNKAALVMVDYPARARLKIYARAEVVELKDDPALYAQLDLHGYKFRPERMMVLHIEAYDWNCPRHITPRYTAEEIEEAFSAQKKYTSKLEAEIKLLKQKIKKQSA